MGNITEIAKNLKGAFYAGFAALMALALIYSGFDFLFLRGRFLNGDAIVVYRLVGFVSFVIGLLVLSVSLILYTFVKLEITDQKLKYAVVYSMTALGIISLVLIIGVPRTIGQNMAAQNGYVLCLTEEARRDRGDRYYAIDEASCDTFRSYYASRLREWRNGRHYIDISGEEIRYFNRNYPDGIQGTVDRRDRIRQMMRR